MQASRGQDHRVQQTSIRGESLGEDERTSAGARRSSNLLAFALRIQAAGINRRLKQDMIDQDPTLEREALRRICFFEPELSDAAVGVFEHYVNAKWPLRVYAIEPVIAQQNVADAYSRTDADGVRPGRLGPGRARPGDRRPDRRTPFDGRRDGRPPEPDHGRLRRRPRARSAGSSTRGSSPAGVATVDS